VIMNESVTAAAKTARSFRERRPSNRETAEEGKGGECTVGITLDAWGEIMRLQMRPHQKDARGGFLS